jgi:hypothetical protein
MENGSWKLEVSRRFAEVPALGSCLRGHTSHPVNKKKAHSFKWAHVLKLFRVLIKKGVFQRFLQVRT